MVEQLEIQKAGDYWQVWASPQTFVSEGKILDYVNPKLFIKMTVTGNGRGVFTNDKIETGELLVVERAITSA